jgi:hypothetical protein
MNSHRRGLLNVITASHREEVLNSIDVNILERNNLSVIFAIIVLLAHSHLFTFHKSAT